MARDEALGSIQQIDQDDPESRVALGSRRPAVLCAGSSIVMISPPNDEQLP
jgi:hypothetical protein